MPSTSKSASATTSRSSRLFAAPATNASRAASGSPVSWSEAWSSAAARAIAGVSSNGQPPKSTVNGIEVGRSRFEHLSLVDFEQHQRRSDRPLVEAIRDVIHGVVDLSR